MGVRCDSARLWLKGLGMKFHRELLQRVLPVLFILSASFIPAQYADALGCAPALSSEGHRHRGLALGFDVADEILKPVSYVEQRPTLTTIDPTVAKWLLFTKFADWRYEQETRVFTTLQERDPSGLYFGQQLQRAN